MNGDVRVVDDVAVAFAALVADEFEHRKDPSRFSIAFSGGSSVAPCYEQLAKTEIDWTQVTAVWSDERAVPLDHPDSNYAGAKAALFDKVEPLAAVHPMNYARGADEYDTIIRTLEPIDIVHLGMGPDGHTASLFPGSPALESAPERLVVETGDELHPHPRLSFTFAAIARSRLAVFTVSGEKKREMFGRIREGEHFPAGQVAAQRVIWLADSAAVG